MRILGIDLGSSSLKAVEMDSAFGRYDVHDHHEHLIPPGTAPELVLSNLIKSLAKRPDKIIVSIAAGQTTFRNLQMPTRDRKAIQSGVGFELEDELPFSLEDAAYDYTPLIQSKQSSTIHVVATLKKHLIQGILSWDKGGVDPDVITSESWVYRGILNRILTPNAQESPTLLAQMGHTKTVLYLHWKNAPILIREIPWGGRDMTAAISKKYQLPLDQAEAQKLDHGFISAPDPTGGFTEEQTEFSKCIEESLRPLLNELRQIGMMSKNITHHSLGLLYLSGGTSLLPGLHNWIQERLNVPTKPLLALSATTASGVTYSEHTDAHFLLAASLTLAWVGPDRSSCINFRKGEFTKQSRTREINFQAIKKPLLSAATVAFCLFSSLIIQSNIYRSRLTATNKQLESSIKSFFGQISGSALKNYLSNTAALRTSINKELMKQDELNRLFGPNARSPIHFLNSISSGIPKDVIVDLTQFQVGSSASEPFSPNSVLSASLTFLVANPQTAEKLATLLGNKMGHLQRGKMEEVDADGGLKKWKISFAGKPTEETYGK